MIPVPSIPPGSCDGSPAGEQAIWRAGDAWVCTVVLRVLSFCINLWLWTISDYGPGAAAFLGSPFTTIALYVFRAAWWLLMAYLFARPRSVPDFLHRTGLSQPPTLPGWFAAWLGVGIGWFSLYAEIGRAHV